MRHIIKAGIVFGLAAEAWTIVFLAMGLHKHPTTAMLFYLVIVIQAIVLFWGLRQTAAQGRTFGKQVVAGLVMTVVGACIIFMGSFLLTQYGFPESFRESEEGLRLFLQEHGSSEADIQAQVEAASAMHTPLMNALLGVIGSLATGLLFSIIVAIFVRARPQQSAETDTGNGSAA